jgi:hypothetical protein
MPCHTGRNLASSLQALRLVILVGSSLLLSGLTTCHPSRSFASSLQALGLVILFGSLLLLISGLTPWPDLRFFSSGLTPCHPSWSFAFLFSLTPCHPVRIFASVLRTSLPLFRPYVLTYWSELCFSSSGLTPCHTFLGMLRCLRGIISVLFV